MWGHSRQQWRLGLRGRVLRQAQGGHGQGSKAVLRGALQATPSQQAQPNEKEADGEGPQAQARLGARGRQDRWDGPCAGVGEWGGAG